MAAEQSGATVLETPGSSTLVRFEGAPAPEPFVVACCPIRNRAWAVMKLYDALCGQGRPPERLLFVEGDSEDRTRDEILGLIADIDQVPGSVGPPGVYLRRFDTGCPGWSRDGNPRYSINDHEALARVYNECIDEALRRWTEATHIWMIDSDVEPAPDVLALLLAAEKDVVAAAVRNSPGAWNFMSGRSHFRDLSWSPETDGDPRRNGTEGAVLFREEPLPVALVSACVLYRREVLERLETWDELTDGTTVHRPRCRFAPDPRSHDFGMMRALRAAGIQPWVEPRARCAHWYYGPDREPLR